MSNLQIVSEFNKSTRFSLKRVGLNEKNVGFVDCMEFTKVKYENCTFTNCSFEHGNCTFTNCNFENCTFEGAYTFKNR